MKTITDHKAAFISSKVILLSKAVATSPSWQDSTSLHNNNEQEDVNAIPGKVVEDILTKVNTKIKSHNRRVFSTQSQRHVAEQIDALYWKEVLADNKNNVLHADANTTWVKKSSDLCDTATVKGLPDKYRDLHVLPRGRSDEDGTGLGEGGGREDDAAERYEEQRHRLGELVKQRDLLVQKSEMYRYLKELLEPFEGARENVQPNLVTKDGELARELERMRVLIARVGSRIGSLQHVGNDSDTKTTGQSNDDKMSEIFGLG